MINKIRSVLFLGKANDGHVDKAVEFCRLNFPEVEVCLGKWDEPLPKAARLWQGDCIISYLSRWIIPADLLKRARTAINFHPGPAEYPGYGCNNFAVYEDAREYGVTCHHMAPKVDTGAIISTKRFPVLAGESASSLLARAYDCQLKLFYEIVEQMLRGEALPVSMERWTRKPYTRKQFGELGRITPDMSKEEIARRIRATAMGAWNPTIELHGFIFEYRPSQRN
jgi:methionyl-tRNA formyltransferase